MQKLFFIAGLMLFTPKWCQAQCFSISVSSLTFGSYIGSQTNATATVTAFCTFGFAYKIGLGPGNSGVVTARTMNNASNLLNYGMYRESSRTTNWGNTGTADNVSGSGTGSYQTFTIYAQIPANQQLITPATYNDTGYVYIVSGPTNNFSITATVPPSCTVSATTLDFGVYSGAQVNVNSTITATCTNTTTYTIALSAGNAPGATVTTRKMAEPGGALQAYSLFLNSDRTQNWGRTSGAYYSGIGNGLAQSIPVYGRVAAGQSLTTPGSYSDTIVATLTY